jgi:DNA-binding transcriptional MerR regulator
MSGTWTIGELSRRATAVLSALPQVNGRVRDVPGERLIRWYTTIGLLDPPLARRGRVAIYGHRHLMQLVAIKRRQADGRTIAQIQAELAGATDATLAAVADLPPGALPAPPAEPAPAPGTHPATDPAPRFWTRRPAEPHGHGDDDPEPDPAQSPDVARRSAESHRHGDDPLEPAPAQSPDEARRPAETQMHDETREPPVITSAVHGLSRPYQPRGTTVAHEPPHPHRAPETATAGTGHEPPQARLPRRTTAATGHEPHETRGPRGATAAAPEPARTSWASGAGGVPDGVPAESFEPGEIDGSPAVVRPGDPGGRPTGPRVVHGVGLTPEVTLLLGAAHHRPTDDDLRAIAAAARPLLDVLRERGLRTPGDPDGGVSA